MKKRNQKLQLNRETVRNLISSENLERIQGGIVSSDNEDCMRQRQKTTIEY